MLYPVAWVRIRLPETPKSKAWFTAKHEAKYRRNNKRFIDKYGSFENFRKTLIHVEDEH